MSMALEAKRKAYYFHHYATTKDVMIDLMKNADMFFTEATLEVESAKRYNRPIDLENKYDYSKGKESLPHRRYIPCLYSPDWEYHDTTPTEQQKEVLDLEC
jgi:hypothetical protein